MRGRWPRTSPIGFGELTKGQKLAKTIARDVAVARPLSQSAPKVGGARHRHRPAQIHVRSHAPRHALRPRAAPAGLRRDARQSSTRPTLPGVTVVHEKNFVGVAAPDAHAAAEALRQIKAEWKREPVPPGAASGPGFYEYLKQTAYARRKRRPRIRWPTGMAAADIKLRPLTRSPTSRTRRSNRAPRWPSGRTASSPFGPARRCPSACARELASAFGIPEDRVRVIVPDTGSAYGGKHSGECAVEAARLAKAAGKPVKLVWTREEEFTWSYFRPAGLIEISSGVRRDGSIAAWECHNYNSGGSGLVEQVRYSQPAECLPSRQIAPAAGILPRPGRHRQPFRARGAHG